MPRPRKGPQPNAVIASAAKVVAGRRKNRPQQQGGGGWQAEVWTMLDTVGELEFYRSWKANALSRVTLSVVEVVTADDGSTTEVPVTRASTGDGAVAWAAMQALFGGDAGQSEMLAAMESHIALPGETWLCGLVEPPDDPSIDQWRVLSASEVVEQGKRWQIDRGDGEPETYDAEEVFLIRIWNPHPRKWVEAHSSVRSALPILRELVGLSKSTAASIDSRLAGAGILALPSEITFSSPAAPDADDEDPTVDPFFAALTEAMVTAIEDRADPSAVVPLVIKAPAEHLDKIQHITFATDFSKQAKELRAEAIQRLAASLDVPAEVLTGMADVNHWTGWLLDENAIKMHIEPDAGVITHGLTTRYLWPCLQGTAEALDPALRRFKIKADTSALRQRPNHSAEAQALHGNLTITDAALARETGFEGEDLLSHPQNVDEFKRRLLMKAAQGIQTADVTVAALHELGVSITPAPSEVADTGETPTGPPAVETPAPPPAIEAPRDIPSQDQAAALLAAAEVMVLRAVERGWNRAGKRGRVRHPVPAQNLDAALSGCWDQVRRVAALLAVDEQRLQHTLDTYARTLLTTGAEHQPQVLATRLVAEVLATQPPAIEGRT